MLIAQIILVVVGLYAAVGVVFAEYFVARGAKRLDPAARDSHLVFYLFILPGAAALWPVLMRKLAAARKDARVRGEGKEGHG